MPLDKGYFCVIYLHSQTEQIKNICNSSAKVASA